jgi:hypothetical protein
MPAATNAKCANGPDIAGTSPAGCQLDRRAMESGETLCFGPGKKFAMIAGPNDPFGG